MPKGNHSRKPKGESSAENAHEELSPAKKSPVEKPQDLSEAERFTGDIKRYADLEREKRKLSAGLKELNKQGLGLDASGMEISKNLADIYEKLAVLTDKYGPMEQQFVAAAKEAENLKGEDRLKDHQKLEEMKVEFFLASEGKKKKTKSRKKATVTDEGFTPVAEVPMEFGAYTDSAMSLVREMPDVVFMATEIQKSTRFAADQETTNSALAELHKTIKEMPKPGPLNKELHFMPPPPNPERPFETVVAETKERITADNAAFIKNELQKDLTSLEKRIKGQFGVDAATVIAAEKKNWWGKMSQKLARFVNPDHDEAIEEYKEVLEAIKQAE